NRGVNDSGGNAVVNNQGNFTKSGSAATSTISTLFNNSGTVNVQSGTLNLSGGGTDSGIFNISALTTARFSSNFLLTGIAAFFGGSLAGTGTLALGSGTSAEFSSAVAGPTVAFSSGNAVLTLDNPSAFQS